jgi:hypothetical protein
MLIPQVNMPVKTPSNLPKKVPCTICSKHSILNIITRTMPILLTGILDFAKEQKAQMVIALTA